MAFLTNYLSTHRKRAALSQEEVGFLLGVNGLNRDNAVCRHESASRLPCLRTALAYEVIYDKPIRELFAGLHAEIEQQVAAQAGILRFRKGKGSKPQREALINRLWSKKADNV